MGPVGPTGRPGPSPPTRPAYFPGLNALSTWVRSGPPDVDTDLTSPTPGAYHRVYFVTRPFSSVADSTRRALNLPAGTSTSSSGPAVYLVVTGPNPPGPSRSQSQVSPGLA